jgi:hypothetical protein
MSKFRCKKVERSFLSNKIKSFQIREIYRQIIETSLIQYENNSKKIMIIIKKSQNTFYLKCESGIPDFNIIFKLIFEVFSGLFFGNNYKNFIFLIF